MIVQQLVHSRITIFSRLVLVPNSGKRINRPNSKLDGLSPLDRPLSRRLADRAFFPYSDFRCLSSLTTDGNSYVVPSILKCDDPSDQTACLASLSCEYCSVVVVPTSGFTFSSVAGQCGCTGTCNSDNSCAENAILNIQNQCECIFDTIAALDESSNEKCQEVTPKYYSIGME